MLFTICVSSFSFRKSNVLRTELKVRYVPYRLGSPEKSESFNLACSKFIEFAFCFKQVGPIEIIRLYVRLKNF